MIIKTIVDNSIFPLKPSDTAGFAIESFMILKQDILPVVQNKLFLGYVSKGDVIKLRKSSSIKNIIYKNYSYEVNENQHFFEALALFSRLKAPFLVSIDNENNYSGTISQLSLIYYLAGSYTLQAEGSVINLKLQAYNYSLNEINRIIESEDAKILGLNIYKVHETNLIILSIKLNTLYIDRVIFSLQRFGYEITDTFFNRSIANDVEDRYQSLVKYLEL